MVWYFIGVYIINRTLHGRLEIRNFPSHVEKNISLVCCTHSKRNVVSPRSYVKSSTYVPSTDDSTPHFDLNPWSPFIINIQILHADLLTFLKDLIERIW